jgi:hypothetical protein
MLLPNEGMRSPDRMGLFLNSEAVEAFAPQPNNNSRSPTLQSLMLQFACDFCGTLKQPGETWINGAAAENVGTQAARREVVIDSAWRRERAILPFAVHFCSVECKNNYLTTLFDKPASLLEVESAEVEPATGARVVRARKKPAIQAVQSRTTRSRKTGSR